MSTVLTARQVVARWNKSKDCSQFLGTLGQIPVSNYIFFHPGFNYKGGHRRAVYFAQNGSLSFIFYCEKPKTGRRTREKRSMVFLSDIRSISVSADAGTLTGEEWDQTKTKPGRRPRSVTFDTPSGRLEFRTQDGGVLPTYSDDLSEFISSVVRAKDKQGLPVQREVTIGDHIEDFVRHDRMTRLAEGQRRRRENEVARLEGLLIDATGDRKIDLERQLRDVKQAETPHHRTPEPAPFTNDEIAKHYDNPKGVVSSMPRAPYSYAEARFTREIPEGYQLKEDVSKPSLASDMIDAETKRAFAMRHEDPGVRRQGLELPAGGRRTRRRGKGRRTVGTRRRRRSKTRRPRPRGRVSRRR